MISLRFIFIIIFCKTKTKTLPGTGSVFAAKKYFTYKVALELAYLNSKFL